MSKLFDGLLPEQQTRMFDKATEDGLRKTPPGMAHWAGSGPDGKTCRECRHYTDEGRYTANSKKHAEGQLKPGRCREVIKIRKAQEMTKGASTKPPVFPFHTPACKYFDQHPNPPVAVERKHGNYGY